jgi:hypothetical protein
MHSLPGRWQGIHRAAGHAGGQEQKEIAGEISGIVACSTYPENKRGGSYKRHDIGYGIKKH